MTTLLNKAGKRLFEKNIQSYAPSDPLYEEYVVNGKTKKRKRQIPPGLSKRDEKILRSVQRRAHYLDKGFSLCGMRFGWSFVVGIIPIVGDVADISMNHLLVIRKARQADLPPWLVHRMLLNNAVSACVGFVPIVGDVMLAVYKTNSRNAALLEEFLRIRGQEFVSINEGAEGGRAPETGHGKKKKKMPPAKDVAEVQPASGMTAAEVKSGMETYAPDVAGSSAGKRGTSRRLWFPTKVKSQTAPTLTPP